MTKKFYDWLIVADGEPLSLPRLQQLAFGKKILVLDGAVYQTEKANLKVDILLGDFDAVDLSALPKSDSMQVIEAPDQNKTDLEKGIEYLDKLSIQGIAIAAATGRRLQHTFYNLRILKKYHRIDRPLSMYSENEYIAYYQDQEIILQGKTGQSLGIFGFPSATITTSGLKYNVQDYKMDFEKNNSVSNSFKQEQASIQIKGSVLIIEEKKVSS